MLALSIPDSICSFSYLLAVYYELVRILQQAFPGHHSLDVVLLMSDTHVLHFYIIVVQFFIQSRGEVTIDEGMVVCLLVVPVPHMGFDYLIRSHSRGSHSFDSPAYVSQLCLPTISVVYCVQ